MNLSGVIGSLPTQTLSVSRQAAGTWTKGLYSGGTVSTVSIDAIVCPASPKAIQKLPEAMRNTASLELFAGAQLKVADEVVGTQADRFSWCGRTWEIQQVSDWNATAGYWHAIAIQVQA